MRRVHRYSCCLIILHCDCAPVSSIAFAKLGHDRAKVEKLQVSKFEDVNYPSLIAIHCCIQQEYHVVIHLEQLYILSKFHCDLSRSRSSVVI